MSIHCLYDELVEDVNVNVLKHLGMRMPILILLELYLVLMYSNLLICLK